jgi:hypothetical protein
MNTLNSTTTNPSDVSPNGAGNGKGISAIKASPSWIAAKAVSMWAHEVYEQQELVTERLEALEREVASVRTVANRMHSQMDSLVSSMQPMAGTLGALIARTTDIAERQEVEAHNAEQIRVQGEQAARRLEELSTDFIERNVEDPLHQELLTLATQLSMLSTNCSEDLPAEVGAVAAKIVRFLEERGLTLLWPSMGDEFDARLHCPIQRLETASPEQVRRLAAIYHPGLQRQRRVVQPARVAIYVAKEPTVV